MEEWIEIGRIVAPQGLKGELRVNSSSDFPERFLEPGTRWLQEENRDTPEAIELLKGYRVPGKNIYVVQLEGIENRDRASSLRGAKLLVPASDRPHLEEGEFHVIDLINLEVYNQLTGENLGTVVDVYSAGNDLLEIKLHQQPQTEEQAQAQAQARSLSHIDLAKVSRKSKIRKLKPKKPKPRTILIPFVNEIVPLVDLEKGRLEITPPDGLLELNTVMRQTLDLPQLQLSYLEWNQGKKPLILLHGLADLALVWKSLGEHLASDYHIIAPDLRGHGESGKPTKQGYSSTEIIADLEALMEHLGWSSAHILGHSWGAKLAAIWATKHPQLFQSLILVDPFFIGKMPSWFQLTFPILYRVLPFLKMMGPFPSYEAAETLAKELKQYQGWSELQQEVFAAGIEQKQDGSWGSKFVLQARNEIFVDVMKVAGLTKPLDVPSLFIQPEQGLNRTSWQLKPYQTYLTNLKIVEVPGNHWPFLVEPEAFNRTVAEFLALH